jgi:hypothetical protein
MQLLGIVASFFILAGTIGLINSRLFVAYVPSNLSVALFLLGVALSCAYFWWYKHLRCPKCHALLVKPQEQSTDTFIYPCSGCHIHWDTGIRNDGW